MKADDKATQRRERERAKRRRDQLKLVREAAAKFPRGCSRVRVDADLLSELVYWAWERLRDDNEERHLLVPDFKAAIEALTGRETAASGIEPWWRSIPDDADPSAERPKYEPKAPPPISKRDEAALVAEIERLLAVAKARAGELAQSLAAQS